MILLWMLLHIAQDVVAVFYAAMWLSCEGCCLECCFFSYSRCCCAVGDVSLVSVAVVNITYIAVGAYDAVVVSGSAVFNAAVG